MSTPEFTLSALTRILREGAGAAEGVDLDGDILDTPFDDLGYESLALLETGGRIQREFGVSIDDTALIEARTPRALIDIVNAELAATAA